MLKGFMYAPVFEEKLTCKQMSAQCGSGKGMLRYILINWRYLNQQRLMVLPREHWEYQLLQSLSCKQVSPRTPHRQVISLRVRVNIKAGFKQGTKEGCWSFDVYKETGTNS